MLRNWKAVLLCAPLLLAACSKDDDNTPPPSTGGNNPPPAIGSIIGIEDLQLLQFSVNNPSVIQSEVTMTGFANQDASPFVLTTDFRPSNGALYVLMSDNRLYTVNTSTGIVTQVAQLDVGGAQIVTMNFDPTRDRLRVLTTSDGSFDFFPDGTLAGQDDNLRYADGDIHEGDDPTIDSLSYTGGAGAVATNPYGIDSTFDTLVMIGAGGDPTNQDRGQVHTVAPLSQPVGGAGAPPFDIETVGTSPSGYLTDSDGTQTHLFRVNLSSGQLTDLGEVGVDRRIQALAVVPGTSGGGGTSNPPPPPPTGGVGGEGICTTQITGAGTTAEVQPNDPQCIGCVVYNPFFAIDGDPESFATYDLQLGLLLGGVGLRVHAPPGVVYPSGRIAGGVFNFPGADLLTVAVAPDLTISTFLGDEAQDSNTLGGDTVVLDIAHSVQNADKFFAGLTTTKPFDSVEIKPDVGLVGAFTRLNLYSVCAGSVDEGTFP